MKGTRSKGRRAADAAASRPTRRQLLVGLGSASAAAAAALIGSPAHALSSSRLPTLLVPHERKPLYRFTTRGRHACRACSVHHRYVVGASARALNAKRAHPGCNCPIEVQIVTIGEFTRLFPTGSGTVDLRKL